MLGLIGCVFDRNKIGKYIACGAYHTFILKNDGSLWSCGLNSYGQLGNGINGGNSGCSQVNNDVKQVACGGYHTFILKNDGSVWATGINTNGNLGLGDTTNRVVFTQVTTNINNDVKQIACGDNDHTFILKTDGSLWSCGYGNSGQLGLGDTNTKTTFTQVTTNINNDVKQVICGGQHTFILKNDGTVWATGLDGNGQLGLGGTAKRTIFTQVNIDDVKQVSCGRYHTFILKNDGSLWSCGYNYYGGLGLGHTSNRLTFTQVTTNINNDVKQVACGWYHTFIIKNDGSVWACGLNDEGQLGLGTNDTNAHSRFTQVTTNINNDVKEVFCGEAHTFILKNDNSVLGCGYNDGGFPEIGNVKSSLTFSYITSL